MKSRCACLKEAQHDEYLDFCCRFAYNRCNRSAVVRCTACEDENIGMIPWNASLHLANQRGTDIHDHIARQSKPEEGDGITAVGH